MRFRRSGEQGCYKIDNDATGSYPHLREHEDIWFRLPPGRISVYGHLTFWSNDARDFDSPITKDRYYYLPRVVAHEFGHAFGAFHPHSGSRVFDDRLMGTYEFWRRMGRHTYRRRHTRHRGHADASLDWRATNAVPHNRAVRSGGYRMGHRLWLRFSAVRNSSPD